MNQPSIQEKKMFLISCFLKLPSANEKYEKIIEMGRKLPPLASSARLDINQVMGCQSLLYLETVLREDLIYFNADSEALISKGLAALLIEVYSGQPPELILKETPLFLQQIGLTQALSPARSNGVLSLFQKMQAESIKILSIYLK